jgi:hypothetical protein
LHLEARAAQKSSRQTKTTRTHTTRRTINQNLLPWLNLSFIAKTLQGDDCRFSYSRCFLEAHIDRFQRYSCRRCRCGGSHFALHCHIVGQADGEIPTVIRALQARRRAVLGAESDADDTANEHEA